MSLRPSERLALEHAVRITNAVIAGDGDALRVATALTVFAQIIAANDLHARFVVAAQMLDAAQELMGLPRVDETASGTCNGHRAVLSGSR
jgi:hypothetical protein